MITFLASPKAFVGAADANQRTAIASWRRVHPDVEVILYGDAPGTREAALALGVRHVAQIETSAAGVPIFNAIVEHAASEGRWDTQIYLNCDIILTSRICEAIESLSMPRYLMIGQRIDLSERATRQVHHEALEHALHVGLRDPETALHAPSGVDYFVFTRGLWAGLPRLVVGRGGYDGALVAFCLRRAVPVVDATLAVPALHQFHDYGHVAGAEPEVFWGQDARDNRRLHGVEHSPPCVVDATWKLVDGRVVENRSRGDWLRHLETELRFRRGRVAASYAVRALWRLQSFIRMRRAPHLTLADLRTALREPRGPSGGHTSPLPRNAGCT